MSQLQRRFFMTLVMGQHITPEATNTQALTNAAWHANENEAKGYTCSHFLTKFPKHSIGVIQVTDITSLTTDPHIPTPSPIASLWNEPSPSWDPNQPSPLDELCTLPPPPFYCTRSKGHTGPCATVQHQF